MLLARIKNHYAMLIKVRLNSFITSDVLRSRSILNCLTTTQHLSHKWHKSFFTRSYVHPFHFASHILVFHLYDKLHAGCHMEHKLPADFGWHPCCSTRRLFSAFVLIYNLFRIIWHAYLPGQRPFELCLYLTSVVRNKL